ncbi:lysozyme C-like [Engraulis encrasicolus]|uniref:lysozyme C-like n=1 Tax=Engraulis encrasicolus TaxID=184585 RepID=UPI002FD5F96F
MRVLVFLLLVAVASAKVFKRCELARTLKNAGMDGYMGATLGDWVCMAKWESGFDTKKVSHTRHSLLYGIFQISSEHWCKDGKTQSDNHCKTRCAVSQ